MGVTIDFLQIENVKRVKALALEPNSKGLTVIGGKNKDGKTSVLDAIAWALGGKRYEPTNAQHDGAMNPPSLRIELSNGLVVERKGKNSALTVTDPKKQKHGQSLLDSLVGQFALDLPKFMGENDKGKAEILLQILGIGDELKRLDQEENRIYNERHAVGQERDKKVKYAEELPEYPDAPDEPVSALDLIKQQQMILAKNGENEKLRDRKEQLEKDLPECRGRAREINNDLVQARKRVVELEKQLANKQSEEEQIEKDLEESKKTVQQLKNESTAEVEKSLEEIETINAHVAANQQKANAQDEAQEYAQQYGALSEELEATRKAKIDLLNGTDLPYPGLAVTDNVITLNEKAWDCMSGAEQMIVAASIVRCLNPECSFVLMDKLEQFDVDTLKEFDQWLESENLQSIATRVSTGEECTIIIEDGLPAGQTYVETVMPVAAAVEDTELKVENMEWKS